MKLSVRPLIVACLAVAGQASASVIITTAYNGVTLYTFNVTTPRNDIVYVAQINLTAPGIRVQNTGPGGGATETNYESTQNYATRVGAQLAINTAFFSSGIADNVNGLLVSNGTNVSANDADSRTVLNVSASNVATIGTASSTAGSYVVTGSPALYNAVAGSERIIKNGAVTSTSTLTGGSGAPTSVAARTVAGVSQDHNTLYLMTVQGTSSASSASGGMTVPEEAAFLNSNFPAVYDALNFDGGGSASFVYDDPTTLAGPQQLNTPIDNGGTVNRAVAANLAIFATVPEPASLSLLTLTSLSLLHRRRVV